MSEKGPKKPGLERFKSQGGGVLERENSKEKKTDREESLDLKANLSEVTSSMDKAKERLLDAVTERLKKGTFSPNQLILGDVSDSLLFSGINTGEITKLTKDVADSVKKFEQEAKFTESNKLEDEDDKANRNDKEINKESDEVVSSEIEDEPAATAEDKDEDEKNKADEDKLEVVSADGASDPNRAESLADMGGLRKVLDNKRKRYFQALIEHRRLLPLGWWGNKRAEQAEKNEQLGQEYYQAMSVAIAAEVKAGGADDRDSFESERYKLVELEKNKIKLEDEIAKLELSKTNGEDIDEDKLNSLKTDLTQINEQLNQQTKKVESARDKLNQEAAQDLVQKFLEEEQSQVDLFITENADDSLLTKFRNKWFSSGARKTRYAIGGTLGVAGFFFAPLTALRAAVSALSRGVGGYLATESLLEQFGRWSHRGKTDEIVKEIRKSFKPNQTISEESVYNDYVGKLGDEEVLKEAARLQALQIERKTAFVESSLENSKLDQAVVAAILKKRQEILREKVKTADEQEKFAVIMEDFDRELDSLVEDEADSVSIERSNRIKRRLAAAGVGGLAAALPFVTHGVGNLVSSEDLPDPTGSPITEDDIIDDLVDRADGPNNAPNVPDSHMPLVVNVDQWTDYDGIDGSGSASTFIEASGDLQDQIRQLEPAQRLQYQELLDMDREALAQKLGGYRPEFEHESVVIHPGDKLELIDDEIRLVHADGEVDTLWQQASGSDFTPEELSDEVWQDAPEADYKVGQELGSSYVDTDGDIMIPDKASNGISVDTEGNIVGLDDGVFNIPDDVPELDQLSNPELNLFLENTEYEKLEEILNAATTDRIDHYDEILEFWSNRFANRMNPETIRNVIYNVMPDITEWLNNPDITQSAPQVMFEGNRVSIFGLFGFDPETVTEMQNPSSANLNAESMTENYENLLDRINAVAEENSIDINAYVS